MKKTYLAGVLAAALCAPAAQAAGSSDDELVQRAVHVCASCHGDFGRSADSRYPALAGMPRDYTIRQLKDFRDKSRSETDVQAYMWGISALLTDNAIEGLADYYAQQEARPGRSTNTALQARGREIFTRGIPAQKLRACASCHGERAEGAAGFPRLAGQHADYTAAQLNAYRAGTRKNNAQMVTIAAKLSDREIAALADYAAGLQ